MTDTSPRTRIVAASARTSITVSGSTTPAGDGLTLADGDRLAELPVTVKVAPGVLRVIG